VDHHQADPFSVQRNAILGLLFALAATAWALLVWQSAGLDMAPASLTMGLRGSLFITIWVVMMVAMMFPTATPMILTFHRVQAEKQRRGEAFVSTWVFVTAYMLVWTLAGIIAYVGALAAETVAAGAALSTAAAGRIGGAILVAAGLYQITPLKDLCLSKCRTPVTFIMTSWRDGFAGALRMGLLHGVYCLGCCWLLFVILFPLGIMNIATMAVITLVIFAEKTLSWGRRAASVTAAALVVYGAVVVAAPQFLPTFTAMRAMAKPALSLPTDMPMPGSDNPPAMR
jgi:predicted metal-binding membrane protein